MQIYQNGDNKSNYASRFMRDFLLVLSLENFKNIGQVMAWTVEAFILLFLAQMFEFPFNSFVLKSL